jgi:hypothetical protein
VNVVDAPLRLSAQRALLGAIHPQVRLIKISRDGEVIHLTVVTAVPLGAAATEALSIAATEIISDFPAFRIEDSIVVTSDPLPVENVLEAGWVYQRADALRIERDRLEVWHDGSAICVIAVGSHGDPLDLGDHEVEGLIEKLQTALAVDRSEDRSPPISDLGDVRLR